MNQKDTAAIAGVKQPTYSGWENNHYQIDDASKMKLANYFGVSIDYLLGNDNSQTTSPTNVYKVQGVKIPIMGRVVAGQPIEAIQNIEGYIDIPESWAAKGEHFALRVRGHSMEPKCYEGDIAIIRKQENVENGKIALVLVNNSDATIKKIHYQDNGLTLIALNVNVYAPHFYSKEEINKLPVRIIGQVIQVWHNLE